MTTRIHLATEPEPIELHGKADGRIYAVQLAVEVEGNDETAAKTEFEYLLDAFPRALLVHLTPDGAGGFTAKEVDRSFELPLEHGEDPPRVMTWLEAYEAGAKKLDPQRDDFPFYADAARGSSQMRNARAVDLLRSAWRWPAPLAQKAGLVTAAHLPDGAGAKGFLTIVPEDTDIGTVTVQTPTPVDAPVYDVVVAWTKPAPGQWTIRTQDLATQPATWPERFERDGRFVLPANAEGEQRVLHRVEARAASALWIAPLLGTLAQDPRFEPLFQVPASKPVLYSGRAFYWLAQASAMTMFDVLIAGLLLPVSNRKDEVNRRSSVLERLTRQIAGVAELDDLKADVDEDQLYLNLHKALWSHLAGKNPSAIWTDIRATLEDSDRLPWVRSALETEKPPADMTPEDWIENLKALSVELGILAELVESESGGDGWLEHLFRQAIDPATNAPLYGPVSTYLDPARIGTAFAGFLDFIAGDFDASAILRHEFGAEAVQALAGRIKRVDAKGDPADVPVDLRNLIVESMPMVERFDPGNGSGVFDRLWAAAPQGYAAIPDPRILDEGMDDLLAVLASDPDKRADFRPDDRPMPILIPIADNPQVFAGEGAVEHMSGLGFLAQVFPASDPKKGKGYTPVHLNLIGLEPAPGERGTTNLDFPIQPRTVDAMLPLPAPGASALTVAFAGGPLSSPNLTAPTTGGQPPAQRMMHAQLQKMRAYAKTEAEYAADDLIPDPAYGMAIRPYGFWVPPSGVLPPDLRGADAPFEPVNPSSANSAFWNDDTPWLSRRRTAISGADISVQESLGALPGLPKDVHPIALDDPRITVESLDNATRYRDLFRAVGGAGTLGPDAQEVVLKEVVLDGSRVPSGFHVAIMQSTQDGPKVLQPDQVVYDAGKRTLTITTLAEGQPYWLRLWFDETAPAQALSFADPQNEQGQDGSANTAAPLLLAPDTSDQWTIPNKRTLHIDGPRVSFEDLERWASNKELWRVTCGGAGNAPEVLDALRFARAIFEETGHPYAERVKSLPDPAVRQLVIGLAQADNTLAAPDNTHGARATTIGISPYEQADLPDPDGPADGLIAAYVALVDRIYAAARSNLPISEGPLQITLAGIQVPKGTVAHLRVSPKVAASLFLDAAAKKPETGIFHPRMAELAIGQVRDHTKKVTGYLFDGPGLAIEVLALPPKLPVLPRDVLMLHMDGRNRGYSIVAQLPRDLRWVGACDLITQRWRFLGTPIYHWIDVAQGGESGPAVAVGPTRALPADRMGPQDADKLAAFERDAFDPRRDDDADFKHHRLRPADESTVVGQVEWPEKSATYFRHRLELISRYSGAMTDVRTARLAVRHDQTGADPWTARAAILCEPRAITLVRPQLRVYMPVNTRAAQRDQSGPTPITCVLSEPPFAQLGLADRLDADIAVKPLYEVNPQLTLTDLRKEISPDPLLSYFRVAEDVSRGATVRVEGPVGLHFDDPQASAPAWSNTQYLFHLSGANGGRPSATAAELEESFAGLILSRHADPGWCWSDPAARLPLDLSEEIWIEPGQTRMQITDDTGEVLVNVARESADPGAKAQVEITKSVLQEGGGPDRLTLWDGPLQAILLKPLGDDRYRLCLYRTKANRTVVEDGHLDRPQLATSVIFRAAREKGLHLSGAGRVRATGQSEATLIEWARSGRDLSTLSCRLNGSEQTVRADRLIARLDDGGRLAFDDGTGQRAAIASPVAHRRYPLHLHRRLVAILQKPSAQIGHKIDLFDQAVMLDHSGQANIGAKAAAHSAVLAELECPAEIVFLNQDVQATLGADLDAALNGHRDYMRYRRARFALSATTDTPESINQLRVHIRAAGQMLDLTTLSIGVKGVNGNEVETIPGPDLSVLKGEAAALDLVLYRDVETGDAILRVSGVRPDGTALDVQTAGLWFGDTTRVPFVALTGQGYVELAMSDSSRTARWVDVSLTHSAAPFCSGAPDLFDPDWLFGPQEAASDALPGALDPYKLNRLTEAQARLIGVTDAIPFQNRTRS